jgi:hypothetical protein
MGGIPIVFGYIVFGEFCPCETYPIMYVMYAALLDIRLHSVAP